MGVPNAAGRLVREYLDERARLGHMGRNTVPVVRVHLLAFARSMGKRPLRMVGRRDVERFLAAADGLSAGYRRNRVSALRTFSRWLLEHRHVDRDFMAGIEAPRPPRAVPRAMAPGDVGELLAACPDARGRLMVWLMVGEGLRCCEVAGLEIGDYDRGPGILTVVGKGGHQRVLPVTKACAQAIDEYLGEFPAGAGPLVRSYRDSGLGLSAKAVGRLVSTWMRDAGVKRRPLDGRSAHALRHTAASDVLDSCGDLRVVQQMLGHAHLQTTAIYLRRARLGQLREAMEGRRYSRELDLEGAA